MTLSMLRLLRSPSPHEIEISADAPLALGRVDLGAPENHAYASRKQCELRLDEGEVLLLSTGANPTIVIRNGLKQHVPKGVTKALLIGDAIQCDRTNVTFTLHAPQAELRPAAAPAPAESPSSLTSFGGAGSSSLPSCELDEPGSSRLRLPSPPVSTAAKPEPPAVAHHVPHAYRLTCIAPEWGLPASLNDQSVSIETLLGESPLEGASIPSWGPNTICGSLASLH